MSRLIRNERARELQGRRAGIVSRGVADLVDASVAFGIYLGLFAGLNLLWDLFLSDRVQIPTPPPWFTGVVAWTILVLYLTAGWAATGRTFGKQLMGLRVVRADAEPLRPRQAFGRALLCSVFQIGLLLAAVDRRNRAVHDIVCRSVVVYDWIPESATPRRLGPPTGVPRSGEAAA